VRVPVHPASMDTTRLPPVLACAALVAACVQSPHAGHSGHGHGHAPYAGLQRRAIKALSAEQVADPRAGDAPALPPVR
jgi:hypothetical protein